jgi:hypothetical protein
MCNFKFLNFYDFALQFDDQILWVPVTLETPVWEFAFDRKEPDSSTDAYSESANKDAVILFDRWGLPKHKS